MIFNSAAQVVVEPSIDDCWFIFVTNIAECVVFTRASLLVEVNLVLDRAKFLELVFWLAFISHVIRSKIGSSTLANVYLAVESRWTATYIWWQSGSTVRIIHRIDLISLGTHTVKRCVLVLTLGLDAWHIFLFEELCFLPFMRYFILVVVNVINRNLVIGSSRYFVWAQNCVSGLRIHTVGLAWHSNSELRHISSLAVWKEPTIQIGFFVLAGTCTILESLEGLIELFDADTTHFSFLLEEFPFEHRAQGWLTLATDISTLSVGLRETTIRRSHRVKLATYLSGWKFLSFLSRCLRWWFSIRHIF